ncbi:MAG: hypothetical protein H7282_06020 [Cytophagaceae bacterium]|nr:hypothetical protein [Cytophagaceae bacterium]
MTTNNLSLIFLYFTLSTLLTGWFIAVSPLYISTEQMLWSCGIAGGKWTIQLIAGFLLLKEKKWDFIRNIGWVCLIGSILLVPYCLSASFHLEAGTPFFIASLIIAVIAMIFFYYQAVKKTGITLFWWMTWLLCLAVAVSLQLTIVFNVFKI